MRRESFLADTPLTTDSLSARFDPDPRHERRTLVRHPGELEFAPVHDGPILPGDEVVFYSFDPGDDEDLFAVNASFSSDYYVSGYDPPWPDELRVIREFIPASGARVLEVCCGAGRLAGSLAREGNRVAGLDNSVACLEHARRQDRAGVVYFAGDALALPFGDRAFDVACVFENSLGVLFSKKTRALEELLRVAKTRVIVGLREDGADPKKVHTYFSIDGYMEVAQTFTMQSALGLVDGVAAERRARIAHRSFRPGELRPWGGREFFVVLELS